jgi:hypothetical protein
MAPPSFHLAKRSEIWTNSGWIPEEFPYEFPTEFTSVSLLIPYDFAWWVWEFKRFKLEFWLKSAVNFLIKFNMIIIIEFHSNHQTIDIQKESPAKIFQTRQSIMKIDKNTTCRLLGHKINDKNAKSANLFINKFSC